MPAVVVLLLLGACGGGEDSSTTTTDDFVEYTQPSGPTFAEWQAKATAVCKVYEPRQDAAVDAVGPINSLDDITRLYKAVAPIATEYTAALKAVPRPTENRRDIEHVFELNDDLAIAVANLATAAEAGDAAGAQALQSQAATIQTDLEAAITSLEIPACL
jgi:hypothetical protein